MVAAKAGKAIALFALTLPVHGQTNQSDAATALASINAQRASHGLAPFGWDNTIANGAANWAQHIQAIGQIMHSAEAARPNQGEVIAFFQADATLPQDDAWARPITNAVGNWLAGGVNYPPGGVIGQPGSENWEHWAQLMWQTTTQIGCATAQSVNNNNQRRSFVVCRLTPEGNIIGEAPFPSLNKREGSDEGPFTGSIANFTPGLGACGDDDTRKGGILALSHLKMGDDTNGNDYCGKVVELAANSGTARATIKDKCMSCDEDDVAVSEDVFMALWGDLDLSRAEVTWTIV